MELELLKKQVELYKDLISKTEDEAQLKELGKSLDDAIYAVAKAEAKIELEEKAQKEADQKAVADAKANSPMAKVPATATPVVKVGTPELYKGMDMKKSIGVLKNSAEVPMAFRTRAKADPEEAEEVVKFFIDKIAGAKVLGPAEAQKAMVEGTDSAGGYLTPTEQPDAVLSYIRDVSIAFANCRIETMTSDAWEVPRENAKVTVAYTNEVTDATEADPSFENVTLTAGRLDGYTKVSNEVNQDGSKPSGGIAGLLAAQFMEAIGQKVDSTVFLGTGSPISGVFLSAGSDVDFDSGSTAFSELIESNLRSIIAAIRPNRRGNAKFYMATSNLWTYVMGLKDSNGRPLYYFPNDGGPIPGRLFGYPVIEGNDDIMPSTSAAGTGMIVFGDLGGFIIGERLRSMQLFVDPYSLSRSYQTQYLSFTRIGYAHGLPNYYARIVSADS